MIIHDIEQGTDEWRNKRAFMPTASQFFKIITGEGNHSESLNKYAASLAANTYAGRALDGFKGNFHTERGHEFEPMARADYEFENDVTVEQVGFVTDDKGRYGCSPDGLIGKDGALEIKCLSAENHLIAWDYFDEHGYCQPGYVPQTQGEILVCERKWCDLMFFHPDLPRLIIRQTWDVIYIEALKVQLDRVIEARGKHLKMLNKRG